MGVDQEPGTNANCYGHKFIWTDQHPRVEKIQELLYTYDELAVDALNRIDAISPPGPKDGRKCPMSQRDLYALLQEHAPKDEVLGKLWSQVTTVPDWVDWEAIHRGQQLVYQYHGQMLTGLLFNSLLGGMAAWRVVETLARTGGFGVQVTRRRLLETSQHFLEVIEDLDAVKPGGKGFVSSVRVRLLHASVRRRIMNLAKEKPEYYDTKTWGIPINDLHQIGTIDAYSTALVYISLPRQGVYLNEQQISDYLALWRWVGYVMGTPTDWMATPIAAKRMMESVITSELAPSKNSQIIANNILTATASVPPMYSSRATLAAITYKTNGDEMAEALAIQRPGLWAKFMCWINGLFLWYLSTTWPLLPDSLRERRNKKFIKFGHDMVQSQRLGGIGHSASFDFQYTPAFGKMTEMGAFEVVTGSWQRSVVALLVGLAAVGFLSDLVYPWHSLAVERMSAVTPAMPLQSLTGMF